MHSPRETGRAKIHGLEMYYEIHGEGRPLVLLHGGFTTIEGWGEVLPTLAKERRVIAVEQQGHGHTADIDRPLAYEQMAEDTAALLEWLKVEQADVFGYSDGGTVGLGLAIRHPRRVGRLAILGAHSRRLREVGEPKSYEEFMGLPADWAPKAMKDRYDRVAPDPGHWPVLVQKIKALSRDFAGFSEAEMRSIRANVMIMMGDRDMVSPEHAVEMYRQIPEARLAVFPGADHFLILSDPRRVLATLVPFLDGEEVAAARRW